MDDALIDIAVLRAMAAAGATVEMILAAVEAAQKAHADALAKRRQSDNARQQKRRRVSRDITLRHVTSRDPLTSSDDVCDPPVHILTPQEIDPKKDLSRRNKRGSRLPSDWQPDAEGVAFAEGLLGASWRFEAEKFRDYWQARPGSGGVKNDWAATWRNWCRNAVERKPSNGKFNGHASKPSVSDVLARLCDETGPDPDWLLPQIGSERS